MLATYSKEVVHCGPLGAGMITKIARNIVSYSCWAAVREAMSVAAAGGVDPETARHRAPLTSALADKDLAAAQSLAGEIGIGTPIADAVRPTMPATFEGDY